MYLDGEKRRKKIWLQLINRKESIMFFKRSKPVSKKMVLSNETTETNSVKNAETAVVIVVREEGNDVTLTTDQHVVMGNKQNVVDPLRNLDVKKKRKCLVSTVCYTKVHVRLL